MTDKQKKAAIRKHLEKIYCPGCGKEINEGTDMAKIEYVKTKRKTEVLFHTKYFGKVWHPNRNDESGHGDFIQERRVKGHDK